MSDEKKRAVYDKHGSLGLHFAEQFGDDFVDTIMTFSSGWFQCFFWSCCLFTGCFFGGCCCCCCCFGFCCGKCAPKAPEGEDDIPDLADFEVSSKIASCVCWNKGYCLSFGRALSDRTFAFFRDSPQTKKKIRQR